MNSEPASRAESAAAATPSQNQGAAASQDTQALMAQSWV